MRSRGTSSSPTSSTRRATCGSWRWWRGRQARAEAVAEVCDFADRKLGKGVVPCNDTPGFIANRIGTYWLIAAVRAAIESGVTVEEADAVLGRPIGVPKTGIFGLIDLVGLDLMPLVGRSLRDALPESDPFHAVYDEPAFIGEMIESGYIGRKGKGGFYRLKPGSEKKEKEVRDLATGDYGPARRPRLESVEQAGRSLRALFEHPDKTGAYAWHVMSGTLAYTAGLVPEIADDVEAVDRAMRLGYAWKRGPFEMIDSVGADWFAEKARRRGQGGAAAAAGGGGRRRLLPGGGRPRHPSRRQRQARAAHAARRRAPPLRHQADRRSRSPAMARRASGTSATASPASNSTAR